MATLTVNDLTLSGVTITGSAAGGSGDAFDNGDGNSFLMVTNGSGGSITVTVVAQTGPDGLTITNPTNAVANGTTELMGPFPSQWFNDSNGRVNVTYSGTTSVTVKAFRFKR